MIRDRVGETALRAYPTTVRQTRGLEMLGMLLDAGEESGWTFVRESASLVLGGLRERRAITARAGIRRLLADSCCQAVLILLMLLMIRVPSTELSVGPSQQLLAQQVTLGAILVCALIGFERTAAISGLAVFAAFGPLDPLDPHTQLVVIARGLVPIACLLVMVRAPRRRPRDARRLLWLVPLAVLATLRPHALNSLPEALALISVGGILRLLHDPRLAIACSLVWIPRAANRRSPTGAGKPALAWAAGRLAVGLMLTVAAGRLWFTRHSATG